ncbi:ultraviolet-B receptor UVR8 isoform X2 [Orussus abietinus]|uniref:ultraviolet-B receptor UVR8 isoform X2 n=1 Tax=Orussus abietinus TaxID=222816 RepID=UPI000624F8C3|nr:ultraviolet-B receptor UVR8 isoform X2 [Orussus abietinus]
MPKRVKFVDVACGFDHTIILADNGNVYSMGMGTRGQLGHGDLEDCDNPRLVEALAGLRVVQIAAAGWHSAVVTDQGDVYTWGWNTNGQLGIPDKDTKIFAEPAFVDLKNEAGESLPIHVKKVECGNTFTICMSEDHTLWGCGSNKYGQLGVPRNITKELKSFARIDLNLHGKFVKDIKCQEWGTLVITK